MTDRPEQEAVAKQRQAAAETSWLGPGTAGHTISGAAYRGHEVAAHIGAPSPASPGFSSERVGLHPGQGMRRDSTNAEPTETGPLSTLNMSADPADAREPDSR